MPKPGSVLQDWQRRRELTVAEAARMLKISRQHWYKLTSGRCLPGRDLAVRIQKVAGIAVTTWGDR